MRLISQYHAGDDTALEPLLVLNKGLVRMVAARYQGCGMEMDDLIQEGSIGFMRAMSSYDPEKGKLATYAVFWIRQAITRAMHQQSGDIHIPERQQGLMWRIRRFQDRHMAVYGRYPDIGEIAEGLRLDKGMVLSILKMPQMSYSLDEKAWKGDDGAGSEAHIDLLSDDNREHDPEVTAERSDLQGSLWQILAGFPEQERDVLTRRYGLSGSNEMTIKETAEDLGITESEVRKMESRAIRRIKHPKYSSKLRPLLD